MKRLKKILALAIAMAMVVAMALPAMAATNSNTLTIKHNEASGAHTYNAYQLFAGNLDAKEDVLSDITWGTGVNEAGKTGIVTDLKAKLADSSSAIAQAVTIEDGKIKKDGKDFLTIADITSAADVAKVVSLLSDNSKALDEFAQIVGKIEDGAKKYLTTVAGTGSIPAGGTEVAIQNLPDGYYIVLDETTNLADGDTLSKIMLNIVKDVAVLAKDDSIKPDKEIVEDSDNDGDVDATDLAATDNRTKAAASAIGDTVTYEVKVTVPDTTNYNFYKFVMKDQLPAGLTFDAITSIKVMDGTTELKSLNSAGSTTGGAAGTYVVTTTKEKDGEGKPTNYVTPPTIADKVAAGSGGQAIKIVFNKFKALAEGNPNLIGKEIVVTYTAVVNADATYGAQFNQNTVKFEFPNNPNYQYDGTDSDFKDTDPKGNTPEDKTETYVTTLELFKYTTDDGGTTKNGLAGATFEITSDSYNAVVKSGIKYEQSPKDDKSNYVAAAGETILPGTYYKLKDGNYTTAVPGAQLKDDENHLLYVEADGVTITTEATYTDDDGEEHNNTPYVYNTTQYDDTEKTYVKVSYKVVDKTPTAVDANNNKYTVVSGNDGLINLDGLKPGVYTIEETIAPDGYNKINSKYQVTVGWADIGNGTRTVNDEDITADITAYLATLSDPGKATAAEALTQAKAKGGFYIAKAVEIDGQNTKAAPTAFTLTYKTNTSTDEGGKYKIEILNQSGTELPSTGGIGTTIFYVVGAILVIGAGVVLITKRRMES